MAIRVECFASYLTVTTNDERWLGDEKWRTEDHAANKFVHSIKRERINGYARVPSTTGFERLDAEYGVEENQKRACRAFARWARERLRARKLLSGCDLVPIPCSRSTARNPRYGAADALADALSRVSGAGVQVHACVD